MAASRLLSPEQLRDMKGITLGPDQRKALEDQNRFPKRMASSAPTHGYLESEIDDYLATGIALRDSAKKTKNQKLLAPRRCAGKEDLCSMTLKCEDARVKDTGVGTKGN